MGTIIEISEKQPHLTINGKNAVHVLPVSLVRDVIEGRKCITQIDEWNDFLPAILTDYLDGLDT